MRIGVQARIRRRIKERLEDLDMTARELAQALHKSDGWISGVLNSHQGLHWKDFDAVAEKLKLSPSDLVRHDHDLIRAITPQEARMLTQFQKWPAAIRDHWITIWEYFDSVEGDAETRDLVVALRQTPRSVRRPVSLWLARLLESDIPLVEELAAVERGSKDAASVLEHMRQSRRGETGPGTPAGGGPPRSGQPRGRKPA